MGIRDRNSIKLLKHVKEEKNDYSLPPRRKKKHSVKEFIDSYRSFIYPPEFKSMNFGVEYIKSITSATKDTPTTNSTFITTRNGSWWIPNKKPIPAKLVDYRHTLAVLASGISSAGVEDEFNFYKKWREFNFIFRGSIKNGEYEIRIETNEPFGPESKSVEFKNDELRIESKFYSDSSYTLAENNLELNEIAATFIPMLFGENKMDKIEFLREFFEEG